MSLFSGLFRKKNDETYSMVIDIGSESIGVSFVILGGGDKPILIDSERHLIPFQDKININRFIELMKETLSVTVNELSKRNNGIRPKTCLINLASPWHVSQTRVVHVNSSDEFVITKNGLDEMIKSESDAFIKESESKGLMQNSSVIESHIIEVKINGYPLIKPIGRKTKDVELYMHITSSPNTIICPIKEIVEKIYPSIEIVFHSFMFSLYNTIRDKIDASSSFVIIDIAGEVTDISIVSNNILLESISFPVGYRVFQRKVAEELSLLSENAYSEIALWRNNKLTEERSDAILKIFDKMIADWNILFTASLKKISETNIIPRTVYLISEEGYLEAFSASISEKSSDILGNNQEKFKIKPIDSKVLSRFVTNKNKNAKTDAFLCVNIILLEKLLAIENNYNQYICQKT